MAFVGSEGVEIVASNCKAPGMDTRSGSEPPRRPLTAQVPLELVVHL